MTFISVDGYEPPHLSHSTFDSYRSCGMKMALQKVYRVEQRPGWSSIGGSALHSCIETIEEYELDDVDTDALFEDCFKQHTEEAAKRSPSYAPDQYHVAGRKTAKFQGKTAAWWLEEGPRMVHRWLDWRKQTGWTLWNTPGGKPAIEVELNFTLNGPDGEIPVKGFIDSIWQLPSGQLVPLDVKSGRKPDEPIQLGLYKVGMQKVFGVDIKWGYFWDANKGDHGQPVSLDLYTEEYLATEYAKAVRGINAGVFIARPNMGCADWCDCAAYCPAVGGRHAKDLFQQHT